MNSVYRAREAFGDRLRLLREDAGLNGKQLAARLGWSQSKVSRIELGKQTATTGDISSWAKAVDAPSRVLDELLTDLRSLRVEHAAWRRQLRAGTAPKQRAVMALEAATTWKRVFVVDLVPGLFQTPDYARHVFAGLTSTRHTPDDVAMAVRVRMQRQEVLYDLTKRFQYLVTEAALRALVCPLPTLRAQLDRLLVLSALDNVEFAIIPLTARLPVTMHHGFSIFDESLVLIETFSAELSLRDADDIALYVEVFEELWNVALHGEEGRQFIARLAQELVASAPPA